MKKEVVENAILYPRQDVFAAAVAAQRINGEYVKRTDSQKFTTRIQKPQRTDAYGTKLSNGSMMKVILASDRSDILSEDYERAETIRDYFCSMITLVFEGTAKDFIKTAVDAATSEEISESGNMLMLVSSLPSVYERNIKRNAEREHLSKLIESSVPLSNNIGESVKLHVTVVDSIYKERFGSYAVNAIVTGTNQLVFFFDRHEWVKGSKYNLSGRIKSKINKTTQLHYVRQLTPTGEEKGI
jgi:hypothetical protein